MPFSFNSYEIFARKLKDSTDEVDLRNSVSRGYYCFYHKVKNFFGYTTNQYVPHEVLINQLQNDYRISKGAKLSNAMQNMKQERVAADYKTSSREYNFNKLFTEFFWRKFDRTIELLNNENLD